MKSLIFSLLALAVVVGAIVSSSLYIGNVTKNLEGMVSDLAPSDEASFFEAQNYWKQNEHIICLLVSHKDIDNVNLAFGVLEKKLETDETCGFYEYCAILKRYIEEIGKKERFHIDNIV